MPHKKDCILCWFNHFAAVTQIPIGAKLIHGSSSSFHNQMSRNPGMSSSFKDPVKYICKMLCKTPLTKDSETKLNLAVQTLTPPIVMDVLSNLKSSDQTYRFFKISQSMGVKHDIQTYFKIIESLGRGRHINLAKTLVLEMPQNGVQFEDCVFNSLIRSYGRQGNIIQSVRIFKMMKGFGVEPTVLTYNNLFSVLLKRGRTNMVAKYYAVMVSEGVVADVYTYNILIRGFCLSGKVDRACEFFRDMKKRKCRPDVVTYNVLLDGLCRNGRVKDAYKLWRGMKKMNPDVSPNVVTYTTMIRGFCRKQRVDEALRLMDEMVGCGVKPNEITYNTVIQALCDADKLEETKKMVEEMTQGGFRPDACTFNILMNAQCRAGKLDEAMDIFDKMGGLGIDANSATYSVLIRSLCRKGNFDRAVELFDELLQKGILCQAGECTPLVAAYNPMLEFLCGNGKTRKAEQFLRQSLMQGTQDPLSFKTVILGHSEEGAPEAGFEILKLMVWKSYYPDVETFSTLMQSFLHKGQVGNALDTFRRMLDSRLLPPASTFHILIDSLFMHGELQDASRVMKIMLEKDARQNIDISTKVLTGLLCQGYTEEAFERLALLYDKGFLPDMEKLIDDLCREQKYLEAQRLLCFVLRKDCYLDITYYNTVLNGLCINGKALEAFFLFNKMSEKGKTPELTCCEMLTNILKKEGKLDQAKFVSKRSMITSDKGKKTHG